MSQRRKTGHIRSGNPAKLPKGDDVRDQVMGHFRAYEQGDPNVLMDTNNGVLLSSIDVAAVKAYSGVTDKTTRGEPEDHNMIAMVLEGRVNKSPRRAKVLWLFEPDGAAAIVSELVALVSRVGGEFAEEFQASLDERLKSLDEDGHTGPQPSPQPVDPEDFYKIPER